MNPNLYIVPTPVGNLQDMTYRAVETLKSVDLILAEDTRTSGILLKHFDITTPLQAYHMHNEHKTTDRWVERMKSGETLALISDAGTPAISDPGFLLVRAAVQAGLEVSCLPGATAFVPALVSSGLPNNEFLFAGFLPQKKGRKTKLEALANEPRTVVLYESPHKLLKTLQELRALCGDDRQVAVSREISKKFEEHIRGSLAQVVQHFEVHPPKGEFVIAIAPKNKIVLN